MAATYQAVLHDDCLEWRGERPRDLGPGTAVNVSVTILDEPPALGHGRLMADALERIAQAGTLEIVDAAMWEREARAERHLPGRGE